MKITIERKSLNVALALARGVVPSKTAMAIDADQVFLHVTDSLSPILITAPDSSWQCVIMPMREAVAEAPAEPTAPAAAAPQASTKPKRTAKAAQ